MHLPPAVSYEVVRSRWHLFLVCALSTLAAIAVLVFWIQQGLTFRLAGLVSVTSWTSGVAFFNWWKSPVGLLQWDGKRWIWPGFGNVSVQTLNLCLDLQFVALLQLKSADGKSVWLFLDERGDRGAWLSVRRALVAR